jgi:hypothetical protein
MSRVLRSIVGLGVSAIVVLTSGTLNARITWNLRPPGTNTYDWTLRQHWSYNRYGASAGYGGCSGDCYYHSLGSDEPDVSWGGAQPFCLEVTTYAGQYTPNPDTVIEVEISGNPWQLISDDFGGTLQSHARIWIQPVMTTMVVRLRVRPYGPWGNNDEFFVTITRRDLTKSQCTSGQSLPWAQITDSPQYAVTLGNVNH